MTAKLPLEKPVRWLLGARLLASTKDILVETFFDDKFDAREWMRPEVVACGSDEQERFWFDYIADSGDGGKATFSVACLCYSDLMLRGQPTRGAEVFFADEAEPSGSTRLSRGAFLFVGGDTAYHIANYDTLSRRFQNPFNLAAEACNVPEGDRRALFGIPGNHDYYDALHGFNVQFRAPTLPDDRDYKPNEGPRLRLSGFERKQHASYVALKLPLGWWFFGLDSQQGKLSTLDRRHPEHSHQLQFFKNILAGHDVRRLIVATPEPSTVFWQTRADRFRDPQDDFLRTTFAELGLPCGFLDRNAINGDRCQLDLSGDVHQYARYWGPDEAARRDSYASVVSGLGGAFVHPTQVRHGDLRPRELYPSAEDCRKEMAKLAWPWVIADGGLIGIVGAFVALVVYFALFGSGQGERAADLLRFLGYHQTATLEESLLPESVESDYGMFPASFTLLGVCIICLILLAAAKHDDKRLLVKPEEANTNAAERSFNRVLHVLPVGIFLVSLPFIVPNEMANFILSTTLVALVLGIPLGLGFAAACHGARGQSCGRRVLFAATGFLFGLGQLVVPLLASLAGFYGVLAVLAIAFLFSPIAFWFAHISGKVGKILLLAGFVLMIAASVAAPLVLGLSRANEWGLLLSFVTGAVFVCSSFGWYLLVSLAFDGHFNEAGGAARSERFKQIIRFCIRKDAAVGSVLEAYVIAIDDPSKARKDIKAKLIDYFEIAPSGAGAASPD